MKDKHITISKFLSHVLRHKPDIIGLSLNKEGWASVEELIGCAKGNGMYLTRELIEEVVNTNDKKRFSYNPDKSLIRANYGHSIDVDLKLKSLEPPSVLFHGTATMFLESILANGIHPSGRQYVHLSLGIETAIKVGKRHGDTVVLRVDSKTMYEEGHEFYCSESGIWLIRYIHPYYIFKAQ
jgi:putative RNA 2'-phosphotransferase